ncbi:hypothetical protein F4553_002418 [Allocatelliglobosispora scoriae]|uniref:Uncharacterized protein n=1 Tax=Allocatelliglobosispora scoriae TaxID=643052 RepID=A0A841BPC7_9ACTN|nr:hypothetical protein [Allocatelliglobosispora scoriae]MBB5869039.1 hypothetical protein [Allocatelliglobosispora scoriae]
MAVAEEPKPSSGLSKTSTVVTIISTLVGLILAYLTFAATVGWPPFGDDNPAHDAKGRSVAVYKGDSAQGRPRCGIPSCAFIAVELKGFPKLTDVRCTFDSSQGPRDFLDFVGRTDSKGSLLGQSQNYIGTGWVSATCDGVRGELNPW